jgi:hypothetical protein
MLTGPKNSVWKAGLPGLTSVRMVGWKNAPPGRDGPGECLRGRAVADGHRHLGGEAVGRLLGTERGELRGRVARVAGLERGHCGTVLLHELLVDRVDDVGRSPLPVVGPGDRRPSLRVPAAVRSDGDLWPCAGHQSPRSNAVVFVGDEVIVNASSWDAQARLAHLAQGDWLTRASAGAYGDGPGGSIPSWPLGDPPAVTRLARVRFRETAAGEGKVVFAIRWEAAGPDGSLFPVLDAGITLGTAAEQATLLTLVGVYRPPPGNLGAALDRMIIHRAAEAAVQFLLGQVADAIAGSGGLVDARKRPSGVPDWPDGQAGCDHESKMAFRISLMAWSSSLMAW